MNFSTSTHFASWPPSSSYLSRLASADIACQSKSHFVKKLREFFSFPNNNNRPLSLIYSLISVQLSLPMSLSFGTHVWFSFCQDLNCGCFSSLSPSPWKAKTRMKIRILLFTNTHFLLMFEKKTLENVKMMTFWIKDKCWGFLSKNMFNCQTQETRFLATFSNWNDTFLQRERGWLNRHKVCMWS